MEESVSMRNHPVLSDHPVLNGRKRRAFFSNCNANWLLNIRSPLTIVSKVFKCHKSDAVLSVND